MLYVYCPRKSNGALELVKSLGANRLRRFDGMHFYDGKRRFSLVEGDTLVCWGATVPELEGVRVLNSSPARLNKLSEIRALQAAGVKTVQLHAEVGKRQDEVILPRSANHQGGRDLLVTPDLPDYYVRKEALVREFRLHSFAGRSIRAGVKQPREGFQPATEAEWKPESNLYHPWIRSYDAGWRVNYEGFQSEGKMRKIAHAAVTALGLTFGAVDIGEKQLGVLIVLEVNRAPGIEGGSIQTYTRAIQRWLNEPNQVKKVEPEGVE